VKEIPPPRCTFSPMSSSRQSSSRGAAVPSNPFEIGGGSLVPRHVPLKAAPRASPSERALMAGTPLKMGTGAGAGMHASNRHTDAYMAQMYAALEDMGVDTSDDKYRESFDPGLTTLGARPGQAAVQRGSTAPLPRGAAAGSRVAADAAVAMLPSGGWASGPLDRQGRTADCSDRPLLCMSVHGDLAVVGSADHGLVELSLAPSTDGTTLTKKRTLYTKQYGHHEWVTDVSHCPDGRVLSAGMDSKLCLWNAAGQPRCNDLLGHTGSIAKVLASADNALGLSAGYDKSLRFWSLSSCKEVICLRAHRAPVMHLAWAGGVLASADRDGAVVSWDVTTGDATHLGAHGGHATALAAASYAEAGGGAAGVDGESGGLLPRGLVSGGQDGVVRLWDLRMTGSGKAAMETRVHTGAVNDLIAHKMPNGQPLVISSGADKRLLTLDPRMSLQAVHLFEDHRDFIYSLHAIGHIAISGAGDGSVLLHDLQQGKCMYGLGANRAAVRALHADTNRLVCAGDDGSIVSNEFINAPSRGGGGGGASAAARREARLGACNFGGAGASAFGGTEIHLPADSEAPASNRQLSAAEQFAEKKRVAMEKAERLKAERRAKEAAMGGAGASRASRPMLPNAEWDDAVPPPATIPRNEFGTPLYPPGHPMGPPLRTAPAQNAAQNELDALHALGDKKFGKRR